MTEFKVIDDSEKGSQADRCDKFRLEADYEREPVTISSCMNFVQDFFGEHGGCILYFGCMIWLTLFIFIVISAYLRYRCKCGRESYSQLSDANY